MELKSQKNLYKHLWFLLMRHTHTHTHTHQRNTRNLSLEKSCYWAIHTKWSSVWYLPMSFSFSRLSLSWWTPAWTSRPSRSQDHLRTDCRERRPPHKDNITINNLTFLKLGVIQTKLTISWRGQEFFFICTSFGEWMGLALGTITPIHVCFTHWMHTHHMKVLDHVMPREKRWGALDSCFGLVGPHQQSIPQLLSLASPVYKERSTCGSELMRLHTHVHCNVRYLCLLFLGPASSSPFPKASYIHTYTQIIFVCHFISTLR